MCLSVSLSNGDAGNDDADDGRAVLRAPPSAFSYNRYYKQAGTSRVHASRSRLGSQRSNCSLFRMLGMDAAADSDLLLTAAVHTSQCARPPPPSPPSPPAPPPAPAPSAVVPTMSTPPVLAPPASGAPSLALTLKSLLTTLSTHKSHPLFAVPVDPVAHNALDYFDIVKAPMDFGCVSTKVDEGAYEVRFPLCRYLAAGLQ